MVVTDDLVPNRAEVVIVDPVDELGLVRGQFGEKTLQSLFSLQLGSVLPTLFVKEIAFPLHFVGSAEQSVPFQEGFAVGVHSKVQVIQILLQRLFRALEGFDFVAQLRFCSRSCPYHVQFEICFFYSDWVEVPMSQGGELVIEDGDQG